MHVPCNTGSAGAPLSLKKVPAMENRSLPPPRPVRRSRVSKNESDKVRPSGHTEFTTRFRASLVDPAYRSKDPSTAQREEIAWHAHTESRDAPYPQMSRPQSTAEQFALSSARIIAKLRIDNAQLRWSDAASPSQVLLVCGAAGEDGSEPGTKAITLAILKIARETMEQAGINVDILDASLLAPDCGGTTQLCKGCEAADIPCCHWPEICFPEKKASETGDWITEVYERWTAAHAVVIAAPLDWHQGPSPVARMIERLIGTDAGNLDCVSANYTGNAKARELSGRVYGVIIHGDADGIDASRQMLSDALDGMGFVDASAHARWDGYAGQPLRLVTGQANAEHASGTEASAEEQAREIARNVAKAVVALRAAQWRGIQPPSRAG